MSVYTIHTLYTHGINSIQTTGINKKIGINQKYECIHTLYTHGINSITSTGINHKIGIRMTRAGSQANFSRQQRES